MNHLQFQDGDDQHCDDRATNIGLPSMSCKHSDKASNALRWSTKNRIQDNQC
jgi:hypothetical protein